MSTFVVINDKGKSIQDALTVEDAAQKHYEAMGGGHEAIVCDVMLKANMLLHGGKWINITDALCL